MARRRSYGRPRTQRRKSYWLASTGSRALDLEPGAGTLNGAALFLSEGGIANLSADERQSFDEADTLIGLRGYAWLRYDATPDARALAHLNVRLVQFEFINEVATPIAMGRADEGDEGPSSENLLWAGHTIMACDGNGAISQFTPAIIESKAKRKLANESGIYISASLDTFWDENLPLAVTVEWMIRGLFLRG